MDSKLAKQYHELSSELKKLFRELGTLQDENERLVQENMQLREEVSLLRLYIDIYLQSGGEGAAILEEAREHRPISKEALDFYESLPESFNFSELFELADLLDIDTQQMKEFMTLYLRENMMQQNGSRVVKTGDRARRHE